jgi:hypothetical protein
MFQLRAREGTFVEVKDVADPTGGFGFARIEGNNRAIGETGTFAEGGGRYLSLGLARWVVWVCVGRTHSMPRSMM